MKCNKILYIYAVIFALIGCNSNNSEDNEPATINIGAEKIDIDSSLE